MLEINGKSLIIVVKVIFVVYLFRCFRNLTKNRKFVLIGTIDHNVTKPKLQKVPNKVTFFQKFAAKVS
jgi:hypothetical protein